MVLYLLSRCVCVCVCVCVCERERERERERESNSKYNCKPNDYTYVILVSL